MTEVLQEADAVKWSEFISDFDKAWNSFNDNYSGLLAQRTFVTRYPQLLPEYNALVTRANDIREKLLSLKSVRDKVWEWLQSIKGFFGLGAVPLIPIAIGLGSAGLALAAVTKWFADVKVFATKINELRRLEASGLTPQQAASVIAKLDASNDFMGLLKWGAIIVGAILILPLFKKES